MIVVIVFLIALSCHTGMPHNRSRALGWIEMKTVCGLRALKYYDLTVLDVADSRSISPALLGGYRKRLRKFAEYLMGDNPLIIEKSE